MSIPHNPPWFVPMTAEEEDGQPPLPSGQATKARDLRGQHLGLHITCSDGRAYEIDCIIHTDTGVHLQLNNHPWVDLDADAPVRLYRTEAGPTGDHLVEVSSKDQG